MASDERGTATRRAAARHGHVVLAGGGTGGHVFPGLAVAEVLSRRGWTVSWIGRPEGLERRLVTERGLDYDPLPARAVVGRGAWERLLAAGTLGRSAARAARLVRRRRARVVLGTGGYVCAPAVLGARLARRRAVLLEPNARAGAANRWLSRWAAAAAAAWPEAAADLRCPTRLTGVPVRRAFFEVPPPAARAGARLLVLGGSQGARELNRLLPAAIATLPAATRPLAVRHQCGTAHVAATEQAWSAVAAAGVAVEVTPFIADVAAAMAEADLVVSRAGAVTLAEVCAAGRACLLLPLELAGGHQRDNALRLAAAGAALVAQESEGPAELGRRLAELLGDGERLLAMAVAARQLARPAAADEIADLVEGVAA